MRVAVVHDWLYTLGGAEKVLQGILRCFPEADLYCLFDILSDEDRAKIGYRKSTTTFLQRLPAIHRNHRHYLGLMPLAIEQIDVGGYDLVISSSSAVAKGVLTGPDQLHVSYVHSPMRYAWDLQHQYLREAGLERGAKSWLARMLLHRSRLWDTRTAHGVDVYVANSRFVARRIMKAYGRTADVIHPPVAVPERRPDHARRRHFLTASRLVPYKNIRAIIEAFRLLPDQQLVVAGDGPERDRLRALAGPNVSFTGFVPDAALRRMMGEAAAFVFAAEEDFGIVPVEAQAEGTPVIALGRGGALEIVQPEDPGATGLFFDEATAPAIAASVRTFLSQPRRFSRDACHANAARFSADRFDREFRELVRGKQAGFAAGGVGRPVLPLAVPDQAAAPFHPAPATAE